MAASNRLSRWFKWGILGCGIASAIYLGFISKTFVDEASVIVNIGKDTTDIPIKRIVNKATFIPPKSGQLQIDQIDIMLHIVESVESAPKGSSAAQLQDIIVRKINEYTISLSEYRWIRDQFAHVIKPPATDRVSARVVFGRYASISEAVTRKCRVFFRDSVDRNLL